MVNKQELQMMRYSKVLNSIKDDYVVKLILSGLIWLWTLFQDIFATNVELVAILVIAMGVDWISGHIRAKKQGIEIVSLGWRQTVVKALEYALFLLVLTGISNVFGEPPNESQGWVWGIMTMLSNVDWLGFLYLTMTELKSIAENLSGKKGQFTKLIDYIEEKTGFDELE